MTPEEKYARFEEWVAFMPTALEEWKVLLPEELAVALDFSLSSLDVLEAWLIERFPDVRTAFTADNVPYTDGAARYVGETLRRCFGAKWDMEVHDPSDLSYNLPHLTGFPKPGLPIVPLMLVQNAIERRSGDYFAFIAKHRA